MSLLHVRSKVCIAPFQVRSKFAPHMEGSNANFVPHIEYGKITLSANFQKEILQSTYLLGVYITYVTPFETRPKQSVPNSPKCLIKISHQNVSSKSLNKIFHQNVSSKCLIRMFHQNVSSEYLTGMSHKNVSSEFLIRMFHQNVSL